jgi:hypothetical protein
MGLFEWLPDDKKDSSKGFFGVDRSEVPFRFSDEYRPTYTLFERIKMFFGFYR